MSCHDWSRLLAHRLDPALPKPAGWAAARAHLEECSPCRREAVGLDPTLGFSNAAQWTADAADVEAIRLGVQTLRRTGALAGSGQARQPGRHRRGHRRLASALLFATILALQAQSTALTRIDPSEFDSAPYGSRLELSTGPAAPAIEGVDRPQARVYEWGADDLSVVMVVDESLDV